MGHVAPKRTIQEPATGCVQHMTNECLLAPSRLATALYEFRTPAETFCTKTVQLVYAECVNHPPFTQCGV
jgi:hypothetical protein